MTWAANCAHAALRPGASRLAGHAASATLDLRDVRSNRRSGGRRAMSELKAGVIATARGSAWLWRAAPAAWLIAVAMAASIAFRLIPLYLPVASTLASQFIHDKVAADLARDAETRQLGPG